MSCFSKTVVGCLFISVMGGCSTIDSVLPDYRVDYKKSTVEQPLEVPPDLIGSTNIDEQLIIPGGADDTTATFSDYNDGRTTARTQLREINVLPTSKQAQVKRDGNVRWLVLQDEPSTLWPKIKQFWLENGFTLKVENPKIGIMETEWAENRVDIPQNTVRKYVGKLFDTLHSASTRDKYRTRLERGTGTTELYLTHRGAEEVAIGNNFTWQNRPSDTELEAEMLSRLMVFIGIGFDAADTLLALKKDEPTTRANLTNTKDGQLNLIVNEEFTQTWRRTGLALDRVGFTVEDRDRSRGVYFIRYIDPEIDKKQGFFAWLFGRKSKQHNQEYYLSLIDEPPVTRIVVFENDDKIPSNETAAKILTLLHEQLK